MEEAADRLAMAVLVACSRALIAARANAVFSGASLAADAAASALCLRAANPTVLLSAEARRHVSTASTSYGFLAGVKDDNESDDDEDVDDRAARSESGSEKERP